MNFWNPRHTIPSAIIACAALISSCASITLPKGAGLAAYQNYDRPAASPSDPHAVRVKVSLSRQRAYVMEGDRPLLVMPVSVGAPDSPTPRGGFAIREKAIRKRDAADGYASRDGRVRRSSRAAVPAGWDFKGAPLPYWCGFSGQLGFHTGWLKHHPCTDGSIRMHENIAPKFFRLIGIGTPVEIAYALPEDASLGNIPLPPDAGPLPDYPGEMYTGDGYFRQHKEPVFE